MASEPKQKRLRLHSRLTNDPPGPYRGFDPGDFPDIPRDKDSIPLGKARKEIRSTHWLKKTRTQREDENKAAYFAKNRLAIKEEEAIQKVEQEEAKAEAKRMKKEKLKVRSEERKKRAIGGPPEPTTPEKKEYGQTSLRQLLENSAPPAQPTLKPNPKPTTFLPSTPQPILNPAPKPTTLLVSTPQSLNFFPESPPTVPPSPSSTTRPESHLLVLDQTSIANKTAASAVIEESASGSSAMKSSSTAQQKKKKKAHKSDGCMKINSFFSKADE